MTGSYRNPDQMTDLERQMATLFGKPSTFEIDQLRDRIEALTAERDAAVARLVERDDALKTGTAIMFSERSRQAVERAKAELTAEGERRATAAIVAWLRDRADAFGGTDFEDKLFDCADAVERGDHLTQP